MMGPPALPTDGEFPHEQKKQEEASPFWATKWPAPNDIGGIIHSAMSARLLMAELVVVDLTLANAKELERIVLTARLGI
jgi:hypothetical protein